MTYYTNQQIAMFFAVAEHHKLSEAARAMYVSQPSLSKTLGRLEASLGVRLFDRNPDGMKLTKEGEYLYNNFKSSFNQLTVAIDKAREMQLSQESVLRIGFYLTCKMSADFKPAYEAVKRFKEAHPHVQVYLEYMTFSDLRHHLLSGNIDCAISIGYAIKNMLDVEQKKINPLSWGVSVSLKNPISQDEELDVQKLNGCTLLCLSPEESQIDKALNMERCLQVGFTPANIVYLQNMVSVLNAVARDQGICLFGNPSYKDRNLRYFPLQRLSNTPYITAVWRTNNTTPELKDFIDMLPSAE